MDGRWYDPAIAGKPGARRSRVAVNRLLALILLCLVAPVAGAQQLYKYKDENGVWHFSDRPPANRDDVEVQDLGPTTIRPEVTVETRRDGATAEVLVANSYPCPVQVLVSVSEARNVSADSPTQNLFVVPASSTQTALTLEAAVAGAPWSFEVDHQYLPGDPAAEHRPPGPYRPPFAAATSFPVSQGPGGSFSHFGPSSRDAYDFDMPVGTPIHAARAGIVANIARDFYTSGTDPREDAPRANFVRILHDDGTFAVYAHLNWNSVRVRVGQRVSRGQYIADSGNTGFSTGPHLHFAVQRNADRRIISVPVTFEDGRGGAVAPRRGDSVGLR